MAKASVTSQLYVKEVCGKLCLKRRKKLKELIKDKISEQMVSKVIGE